MRMGIEMDEMLNGVRRRRGRHLFAGRPATYADDGWRATSRIHRFIDLSPVTCNL
jgi:hypothetical protein